MPDFPQVWLRYKGHCKPATARSATRRSPGPQLGVSLTAARSTAVARSPAAATVMVSRLSPRPDLDGVTWPRAVGGSPGYGCWDGVQEASQVLCQERARTQEPWGTGELGLRASPSGPLSLAVDGLYPSFHREEGQPGWQQGAPFTRQPLTTDHLFQQLLPGLLLLLWLPASLARHGPPLLGGPNTRTHGTPRCYSAEELPLGQAPAHLLARAAKWEQALPVALVSSLEVAGRRRRHEEPPAGTRCPVLRPEEVLEADIHQRSISPWRYR